MVAKPKRSFTSCVLIINFKTTILRFCYKGQLANFKIITFLFVIFAFNKCLYFRHFDVSSVLEFKSIIGVSQGNH